MGDVGTMLYAVGVFAGTLSEGHFIEYRRMRRMQRRIDGMRGHVVVDNDPEAISAVDSDERSVYMTLAAVAALFE